MLRQIIPGVWPQVVDKKQPGQNTDWCDWCTGSGWDEVLDCLYVCGKCKGFGVVEVQWEVEMGQSVLQSYHDELIQRLRHAGNWLTIKVEKDGFDELVREIETALAAARDQNRSAGQPLKEK